MTSQRTSGWAAAGVLAGLVAFPACGTQEAAQTKPEPTRAATQVATPAQQPAAAMPDGLVGSWKRMMRARDWRPAGEGYPVGTWRFHLDRHGQLDVYLPRTDTVDFSTDFVVEGHRLTIDTVPVCPGNTGRYRWRRSADTLTFTVADDQECTARAALFGGTWTRR